MVVGQRVLDEQPDGPPYQFRWPFGRAEYAQGVAELGNEKQADMLVLRALIALEEGEVADHAGDAFHAPLELWRGGPKGGGMDFAGRVVAQECMNKLGREH